jgi:tetratricopeptide (TPR) repeat protein
MSSGAGAIVGTLEYMAPEQARGQAVDQRADIYAFGLILSDLLAGARKTPPGTTPWEAVTERVSKAPVPLRERAPDIPEALDALVTRCLQIDPAERFQTTADLAAALARLDDQGNLIPEPKVRRLTPRMIAAAAVLVTGLVAGTYWFARGPAAPAAAPPPVSVLIADFQNQTQDPVFDGLLEQALAVGVENASFVSAYPRRDALRLAAQIAKSGKLDEPTATLVALREGVNRVIAGSISKASDAYRIDIRLLDPTQAEAKQVLLTWDTEAADKDAVLPALGRMAARVRSGLGDATAESREARNDESFTAASLDAAHAYTAAQELQWAGKYEDAAAGYKKALELDPNMGRAYSGLGAVTSSLGRRDEAEGYYKQALARLGRMTDREKYRTRGGYYLLTRNTDKAREELQALVKQYPADTSGLMNLAFAEFQRRDMKRAVELGRQASALLPKNVLRKNNTALFAMYAGDFALAEKEAAGVLQLNAEFAKAYVAIGLSQLASDKVDDAAQTYRKLDALPGSAKWFAASGLADLAMYEGRLADAAAVLEPAIPAEKDASRQARLIVTLAEVRLLQGKSRDAVALARKAIAASGDESISFLAGRVLAEAGQEAQALALVKKLLERLDAESLALARVLEGEIALKQNDPRKAIERFRTARQFADSWLGRFGLGRAYLAVGAVAEAGSEFDLCEKRRGEATAALLDDVPTYRLAAPLLYYQARVDQDLGSPEARAHYEGLLKTKQKGDEQGLVADARKRLATLQ